MYQILDWGKLRRFSHIIWDIDGTITARDIISDEVTIKIIKLALKGVYHSFVTGRDAEWIIDKVIQPMRKFFDFGQVRPNLNFFAESGCITIIHDDLGKTDKQKNPEVAGHKILDDKVRDTLRALAYNPARLKPHKKGTSTPTNHDVIFDANGDSFLINRSKPSPPCHPYIWSPHKEVFATFEKIRDENGKVKNFDQTPYVEIIERKIDNEGWTNVIGTEIVATAINIVPKIDDIRLGKSWAAGIALNNIQKNKLHDSMSLDEIMNRTVAIGDGFADLDFTTPRFSPATAKKLKQKNLPIIFVGEKHDLPEKGSPKSKLIKNIIIKATGMGELQFKYTDDIIELNPAKGPRVVSAILDFLNNWDYFGGFV